MLPLLAPDDDAHERYHSRYNGDGHRHQHHQRHHTNQQPGNGTINNLPATGTEQEAVAVVAPALAATEAATASNRTTCPSSDTTTGSPTKPTSKSHPFSFKEAHHQARETDVTKYAQPTRSPSHDDCKHGGGRPGGATPLSRTGTDKSMTGAAGSGSNGGGKIAGGHKIVTPQSFGLDAEAGARLIVGRAAPIPIASRSSSSLKLAGSHGHELSRQPSFRSTNELSAPIIMNLLPSSMAYDPAGWRSCGGTIPSDGGVTGDSGVTDIGGEKATGGMTGNGGVAANAGVISKCGVTPNGGVTSNGGSGCIRYTENENDAGRISTNDQNNRGGCCAGGEERKGGGRGEGGSAKKNHGVNMQCENGDNVGANTSYDTAGGTVKLNVPSRGNVSGSSEHRHGAHQEGSATVSGNNHHPHHPWHQEQRQQQQQKQQRQPQQHQQQQQRKGRRVEEGGHDIGEDRGTLLPGPEGCVEVRELEEGVLVVRRTWHEKKQSPERLNLHRRQLKSCPLVQVRDMPPERGCFDRALFCMYLSHATVRETG